MRLLYLSFLVLLCLSLALAQQDKKCSALNPCTSGCCSKEGNCGFGPEWCALPGCQGTCNAKAECGKYALEQNFDCPLNVCCSQYGFCGTTSEFCNTKCQNKGGCLPVLQPKCTANDDAMALDVRIGYYGIWGASRSCDVILPENIPAGALTHINIAFAFVSESGEITDDNGPIVARISRLKRTYPNLRVNIAIGGWVFNDPPTEKRFSTMVSTVPNRTKFINSLVAFIQKYGLNGVDLDWEYPVADDRGGSPADRDNFNRLCREIRAAFDMRDPGWELTVTLPSSYWYLRGFDLQGLEDQVDWFNVMTYDIHGLWDQKNLWTGPYLKGHTNLTEIEEGLDLLWRNGISPKKVVMGFGFYGRSFTMTDVACSTPPSCTFSGAGFPGDCTGEAGILSYSEVVGKRSQLGSKVFYDAPSSVKWMVYGSNQWISYDDAESYKAKKNFLSSRCLRGLMVWSLDLDTEDFQGMTGLLGEAAMADALLRSTGLSPKEAQRLSFDLSAYTGELCYVTPTCTDGSSKQKSGDQVCKGGYTAVEIAHSPLQKNADFTMNGACSKGWWRSICCPTKAMPKNCEWVGAPVRSAFGCDRGCGASQFELNTDTSLDAKGEKSCFTGSRSLCCDGTEILKKCHWTECGGRPDSHTLCASTETSVAMRWDNEFGALCPVAARGVGLGQPIQERREFCCPTDEAYEDCVWSTDIPPVSDEKTCKPSECPSTKLQITSSTKPPKLYDETRFNNDKCAGYPLPAGMSPEFPLCCSPPSRFTDEWPVEPKYLWSDAYDSKDADVSWFFANNFGSNNKDTTPSNLETDPGDDPYGFIMLDGPAGSIDDAFSTSFSVVRREEPLNIKPRSLLTTNQTILDSVFDHVEETIHVFCNHPPDSKECNYVFHKGAKDTIIRLPDHVGEGPYARIVSMVPEVPEWSPKLESWVIRKREEYGNANVIYRLTFDYSFHLVKRDGLPVNMRVDYTNLLPYWDDITDEPAKRKRSVNEEALSFSEWKSKIDKAKYEDKSNFDSKIEGRAVFTPSGPVPKYGKRTAVTKSGTDSDRSPALDKRWYGIFRDWAKKLLSFTKADDGVLPMGLVKSLTLYSGRLTCSDGALTINAGLDITADVNLEMRAKYGYYFSGTIIPPKVTDMYAYAGVHPRVYAGIGVRGNADLYYPSERRKIIDTLTYPGLAIKGLAAVGPTLDLWGQIDARVTVSGDLKLGATYTLQQAEIYFPNNGDVQDKVQKALESHDTEQEGLQPVFAGSVRADVDLNVHLTPELNLGIKVGGDGLGPFKGTTLVNAQVSAFVNTTINFNAHVTASTSNLANNWSYGYGVYLLYDIGYGCVAKIIGYGQWSTRNTLMGKQKITIYEKEISSTPSSKRSLPGFGLSRDPLPNAIFGHSHQVPYQSMVSEPEFGLWSNVSFVKRQSDTAPGKESEFTLGRFTCTSGSQVCDAYLPERRLKRDLLHSGYHSDSLDATSMNVNADGGSFAPHDLDPRAPLERRAAGECIKKVPRLYYNCISAFQDQTLWGPSGFSINMPGICQGIQGFFNRGSYRNNGYDMTWDSAGQNRRRTQACGTSYCFLDNFEKKATIFGPLNSGPNGDVTDERINLVSCDEFPFASSEEGGKDWLGLYPNLPLGTSRTCVPEWQQNLQGNCNGILNNIDTNTEYFNTPGTPTAANPNWVSWAAADPDPWLTTGTMAGNRQRLTLYQKAQPPSRGLTPAQRAYPSKLSWYHKRNFTLFLSYPETNADVQYPGQQYSSGRFKSNGNAVPGTTSIFCAVSLMGQQRYRWSSDYNGYCWDGTRAPAWGGIYDRLVYVQCKIDFVGSAGPAKRKRQVIGQFGGEDIYGIELLDGPDREKFTITVPTGQGPQQGDFGGKPFFNGTSESDEGK